MSTSARLAATFANFSFKSFSKSEHSVPFDFYHGIEKTRVKCSIMAFNKIDSHDRTTRRDRRGNLFSVEIEKAKM